MSKTNGVTFSKRVLEDLNYPQNVQYCIDAENRVFAIRPCKGNEAKAMPFSKPKAEQTATLAISNKNLLEVLRGLIKDYDTKKRYRVVGQYDHENKVMYYEMTTAEVSTYRPLKEEVTE
ncbi:MAG: hypothetical protein IKD06_00545 [Clostridia bacterium]|nr:hypothetical protein [Clostridia bacterium]